MKKFGLLLVSLVVFLSLFSACNNDTVPVGGVDGGGVNNAAEGRGGRDDGVLSALGSALALNNAMSSFGDELAERLNTTPLKAFGLLVNSLEYGTTTVDFTHSNEWTSWNGGTHGSSSSGNFVFIADERNLDYALHGDITVDGETVDFSAYINMDRLAIGSSLIGGTYGVNYSTIRQDLRHLHNEFGLDYGISASDLDMIADFFESYMDVLNEAANASLESDEYFRTFVDFMLNSEQVSENVDVTAGGQTVNARRVAYNFTGASLANFLRDLLNVFENDESMIAIYGNPLMAEAYGMSHADMIREMRNLIREFEREVVGDFSIAFYIGARDRLVRIDINGTIKTFDEEVQFGVAFDLGNSATDTWRMDVSFDDGWNSGTVRAVWEIQEVGGRHVHEISMRDPRTGTMSFTSDWNPSSGDFIFSLSEDGWNDELLRGNFVTSGGTFRLSFNIEERNSWRDSDTFIEISTARGANIGNVDFISIGDITMDMVEGIVNDLFGFGGGWDDSWDIDWDDFDWDDFDW